MARKKIKQESIILILLTIATLAGISFFVAKVIWPEKFESSPESDLSALENNSEENARVTAITIEELKNKMDANEDLLILDVQTRANNSQASIPTTTSIPLEELSDRTNELPKNQEIIVIDSGQDCDSCQRGAEILIDSGFSDIKKLDGGVTAWADAGYPIIMGQNVSFRNINPQGLMNRMEANEDIIIIDVRDQEEYDQGHIPDAIHMYFAGVTKNIDDYPKNKELIIYDETGNRSEIVVKQFIREGFTNATNLVGGISKWQVEGYEIVK